MTTVTDVRTRIKSDLVITGSDYDAQIDDSIRSALRQLRTRRFWFLETQADLALSSAASTLTLPTDFAAPGTFDLIASGVRLTDGRGFDFISLERLRSEYWTTSPLATTQPSACALSKRVLYFSDIADAAYTVPATYYCMDATLPTATETSVWFDDGYDVVRSLAQYIFKRDSQQYTVTEEDGSMLKAYMDALDRQHERYEGGR